MQIFHYQKYTELSQSHDHIKNKFRKDLEEADQGRDETLKSIRKRSVVKKLN